MGKKYFDTKENTLESSILGVWKEAAKKVDETGMYAGYMAANRQLKDPKKEMMVSKAGKVQVIDKTKWEEMKKQGWIQAEDLTAKQKKIDLDKDGDIGADDLAKLRKKGAKKEDVKEGELPPALKKAIAKKKGGDEEEKEEEVKEGFPNGDGPDVPAMEVGTDRYRDYTLEVTPGQEDPEWVKARDFKVSSMKEALAKVWGLAEKKTQTKEEEEEDEELKPVKGSKTMTGGKPAKVEINPKAP